MKAIIEMAREAGFSEWAVKTPRDLKRFAEIVRADEREACAKQLDALGCDHCAAAIRARGQPEKRNFCPRCGKRTADLTTIHTCTPPT
jgi:ABC-type ATPase with predicted acetyltransferase domain